MSAASAIKEAEPIADVAYLGGGSIPTQEIPTWCVALEPEGMNGRDGANQLVDRELKDASSPWNRRFTLNLLRKEAEALIEKQEASTTTENDQPSQPESTDN